MKTNVSAGDLAILVKPYFPENQDRICTVKEYLPIQSAGEGEIMWYCEFPKLIRTTMGLLPFASLSDSKLRKISGPSCLDIEETTKTLESIS